MSNIRVRRGPRLPIGIGVAATALLLAACGSSGTAETAASSEAAATAAASASAASSSAPLEPTTVNLLGPEQPETFAPVIEAFEAANPGVTVAYTQVPFDQLNSVLEQRLGAGDESIDVYTVDQPRVSQLAAKGYLEDLTSLSAEAKEAFSPAMYDVNFYQDKMWALSVWNSTQMLFYNKDALDKADIEYPSIDPAERWTWEEMAEAGKAAQAAGIKSGFLFEQVENYYQLQPLAESLGGGSGVTGDDMLTPDITNPQWVQAMEWYRDTFESGLQPRGVGGFDTGPVFSSGDTAFFVGGPWDLGIFADSKVNWGIAPQPYFEGGDAVTPTGSWSWGINPASPNKEAALALLKFASLDPVGNLLTTETQTIIPANLEAAAQYLPRVDTLAGEKSAGASGLISYEMTNTAVPRPSTVGYVQFEEVMSRAFADIRNGADAADRLAQASTQLEEAWAPLK